MPNNSKQLLPKTYAEFFAGIGLMRMGLEQAGWGLRFANDIAPLKERLYKHHFQDTENHFHLGNIHEISADSVPTVTLATASFPCTDLSLAGKREGLSGTQSSAFWGFIRILQEMENRRPPLVLLENVDGFLTSHNGKDFSQAMKALNDLGYSVDAFVIDALKFVPQSRVRLFMVGVQNHIAPNLLNESTISFYQSELRPSKLAEFIFSNPDIDWNIRPLPSLPKRKDSLSDIIENMEANASEWWSEERVTYLLNQTFDRHRILIEEAKQETEFTYFTAFRRIRNGRSMAEIRSDGIAGCLRTPKGGSARQILLQVGKGKINIRFLSPLECARLMGAGDFKISGSFNDALFGFGDAVCVPVVKWIADNYLNPVLESLNDLSISESIEYGEKVRSPQFV